MSHAFSIRPGGDDSRLLAGMLGLSLACHLVFGLLVAVLPRLSGPERQPAPFVTVDLVSLPPAPVQAPQPARAAAPKAPEPLPPEAVPEPPPPNLEPVAKAEPVKEPVKAPEPKAVKAPEVKTAAAPPKPAEKVGAKAAEAAKKPPEPVAPTHSVDEGAADAAALKKALAAVEKRVSTESRPDSVARAISDLRKRTPAGMPDSQAVSGIEPAPTGPSDATALPKEMVLYGNDLLLHINRHWAFERSLAGRNAGKLVARVVITILRNGTIADPWFEQRSGNAYFDDSVDKAIKKSNPAPPLPASYSGASFQFGLIFTPPDK